MAYEKFKVKKRPQGDFPMVSILKQGVLSVNQACYEKYLKKHKFVEFLFDKTNQKIGIMPTNEATGDAYPIRCNGNGKVQNISAISFLKHYKIPYLQTKAYGCSWNSKENILEINLKGD